MTPHPADPADPADGAGRGPGGATSAPARNGVHRAHTIRPHLPDVRPLDSFRSLKIKLGVLVAAKFARYANELPKERLAMKDEKLTTTSLGALTDGDLQYKIVRRRRSEA